MEVITLEEIKRNSRIDYNLEDAYLESLGDTAEEMVMKATRRSLEDVFDEYGEVPTPMKHAMLMLVEYLFVNRGEDKVMPRAIAFLLRPYIRLR